MLNTKPKHRSPLRIALGKAFFTGRRYLDWHLSGRKYACAFGKEPLPFRVFSHQTPLLRQLKNVDMWLQHNKINNLRLASDRLNNILLRPGETLSYWKAIGKPTKAKGYLEGMVLFYGGFGPGIGGGLCQLSNLIYWITLHTPLTVTERHRHSYDIFPDSNRTQPFGSGATCVFNYRDLQITNCTPHTYQLSLSFSEDHLCGEWRSTAAHQSRYEVYEKEHRISHEYWGGYVRHNLIYRKEFTAEGICLNDEYLTENHALMMYAPFIGEDTSK